ncbi:MAG: family 10 glycosylhydrolase, partial [bacterium]
MQTVVSSLLFTLFAGGMTGLAAAQGPAPAAPAAKAPAAKAPAAKEALPQPSANPKDFYVQNPTSPLREIRGTWVTTTGNSAIATAANTAATMKQLADIGLNTVYVETWKNGYTQYPSEVLKRTIGVDRRPALVPQDPSDSEETRKQAARDLLEETLIEAH